VLIALTALVSSSIQYLLGLSDHSTTIGQSQNLKLFQELLETVTILITSSQPQRTNAPVITSLLCGDSSQLARAAWYSLPLITQTAVSLYSEGHVEDRQLIALYTAMIQAYNRFYCILLFCIDTELCVNADQGNGTSMN